MTGEPSTPKEIAQDKIARAVRDAYLAMGELVKLRSDRVAGPLFSASDEADLWAIKLRADLLVSDLRADESRAA
ncbi:MAG: hypothetical protein EKK40_07155 [Bradyrhizobiaceae bacterium]|nr:MAG: hypothetical protein EKK40_07155 [Bradyrhizobiaceae bacterium]